MEPMLCSPLCSIQIRSRRGLSMPEKKKTAAAAPAVEAPAAEAKESKTRKSAKAPARRGRPPLAPELYVEFSGKQYNVTDIIDRAKADYRATHKVGVQSCKVYVKPCLLYTSPSPRDGLLSRMPSSA